MMKLLSPLLFFGLLACASVPSLSTAQQVAICGDPVEVREKLGDKYGESLRGWGISDSGKLIEVYSSSSHHGNTWTLLSQKPGVNRVCVLSVGLSAITILVNESTKEDSDGRRRVWIGISEERFNSFAFEIYVDLEDKSWLVKRTNGRDGAVIIMIEGIQWNEVLAVVDGRKT